MILIYNFIKFTIVDSCYDMALVTSSSHMHACVNQGDLESPASVHLIHLLVGTDNIYFNVATDQLFHRIFWCLADKPILFLKEDRNNEKAIE